MKLIEKAKLRAMITSIGKQHAKLRDNIQLACMQCIGHAILHGDVRPATQLMENTNGAVRRQAIVNYLGEHGPFAWDTKENKFTKASKWNKVEANQEKIEAYLDKVSEDPRGPWYEFTKETAIKAYDFEKDVESLLRRVESHVKKGEKVGHLELRDKIAAAFDEYKARNHKLSEEELKKLEEEQAKDLQNKETKAEEQQSTPNVDNTQAAVDRQLRAA